MAEQPIRTTVSSLSNFILANMPSEVTLQSIMNLLTTYAALYPNKVMPISAVQPDFEANKAELQALLSNQSAWSDLAISGIGETILEMIATFQTYNQFAVEQGLHEAMITVAVIPSSIFTATKMLGVRIQRRVPAACPVTLTRTGSLTNSLTLPPYVAFTIGGIPYFSRGFLQSTNDSITFAAGAATISATLYEGSLSGNLYVSNGTAYQSLTFGSSDFTISDSDIIVYVNSAKWNSTNVNSMASTPISVVPTNYSVGLWEFGSDATVNSLDLVYYETTTADGNVQLQFGNNINGVIPPLNSIIQVMFATTNGADGNSILTGATVACTDATSTDMYGNLLSGLLTGVATGPSINGMNERSANEYATLAPGAFVAKNRPTNRLGYPSFATQYPGVIDAVFRGQQEIAPLDLKYMMVVEACILTDPTLPDWGDSDWEAFILWLQTNGIANTQILRRTAQPISPAPAITANLFCNNSVPLNVVESLTLASIQALYKPRIGIIGYPFYRSDIENAIRNAAPTVLDYFTLAAPTYDAIPTSIQYVKPGLITLNMNNSNR